MKVSRLIAALIGFSVLMAAFWTGLRHSSLPSVLGDLFPRAFSSFALLFALLWFSGFGACQVSRGLPGWIRIAGASGLALPYFLFAVGTPIFTWRAAVMVIAFPLLLAAFLETPRLPRRMVWRDIAALALITAAYFLKWFELAWPFPQLTLLPKLFLADVALYCFFVIRELEGTGYSLVPSWSALAVGMREWVFYVPFALLLGEGTRFLHFHATWPEASHVGATVLVTLWLIALPEELFFRAILENLLETRWGRNRALMIASLLFGLSHFNHGASFNWRYVLLAAIAGFFYGRAWRANREILASIFTHTAVDVVWALWFR